MMGVVDFHPLPRRVLEQPQRGYVMPLFMDVHESLPEGATAKDVAQARNRR